MVTCISQLAEETGALLIKHQLKVVTVESCTGGYIAQAITSVAGSSNWFERGVVTYSNEAKQELVKVKPETLSNHGAVSQEVVREMAVGGIAFSHANIAVAVTGIAGPGGGTDSKPVGTVWLGWADDCGNAMEKICQFDGDRSSVRKLTVKAALSGIAEFVSTRG